MRHRFHFRGLNRTSEHRKAMLRNMAQSLVEHGSVTTTLPKAKTFRPFFEKLVTLAIKSHVRAKSSDNAGALRARRALHKLLGDRGIVPKDHRDDYAAMSDARRAKTMRMVSGRRYRTGEPKGRLAFTGESVTHRLMERIAPQFVGHSGGYTRLVRLPERRIGDCAPLATVQLVGGEEAPLSLTKPRKSARRRRADARYAMAIKVAKEWAATKRAGSKSTDAADTAEGRSRDDALSDDAVLDDSSGKPVDSPES